jgi:hypothetical protein
LYEIVSTSKVVVLAVRHQREEDYRWWKPHQVLRKESHMATNLAIDPDLLDRTVTRVHLTASSAAR